MLNSKGIIFLFLSMLAACFAMTFLGIESEIYNIKSYITILIVFFVLFNILSLIYIKLKKIPFFSFLSKENSIEASKKSENISASRQTGLDIIRFIAVFSVPLIHFFGLSGYYNTELKGRGIFYFTMLRYFAVCAVPLFLMITGYFKINKTISKAHYRSILPVLLSHILIASIRLIVDFKYHYFNVDLEYILDKLLYFEYGWYVKLYIGMLLLMPFLNLCYNALNRKSHKQYLILTLILLTSMGSLIFDIIPQSWLILYVFMYYFIGGYLREYKPKVNKGFLLFALAFMLYITSKAAFVHSGGGVFDWDYLSYSNNSGYSSFPVVIITTLIFLLFMDINLKGRILPEIFRSVSVVSLEMYLFSQMFDGIIYTPFQNINMPFSFYAEKIYIIVPTIFCLSFVCAKIKQLIFFVLALLLKGIKALSFKTEIKDISFKTPIKISDINEENINAMKKAEKILGRITEKNNGSINKTKEKDKEGLNKASNNKAEANIKTGSDIRAHTTSISAAKKTLEGNLPNNNIKAKKNKKSRKKRKRNKK